jgi:uncharacterized protein (TIGR02466 family)
VEIVYTHLPATAQLLGDMNIHNLFPLPVAFFNRPVTDEEVVFVKGLETRSNTGNTTSTNNFVLKSMTPLRSWIEDCVSDYFKATTAPKHDVNLKITQSWVNYSEPGQYHHKHAHPNSFVSGVYYLQTNPDDRIYFYKDQYQQIKFPTDDWNAYNSESWWFEAEAGKLILFPSSLTHMVPTVQGDVTRISLSFNTFPVGMVGEEMDLTGLKLEA